MKHERVAAAAVAFLVWTAVPLRAVDHDRDRDEDRYRYPLRYIHEIDRDGFLIGFSAGFGSVYPCDECPGLGGSFHVGGMAERDLAVVFDLSLAASERRGRTVGLGMGTIGARYWPHYKVWLQGGVGIGVTVDEGDRDDTHRAWAGLAAAGYEIVQRRDFAFDVQVRGGVAGNRQSVALNLGFNWY